MTKPPKGLDPLLSEAIFGTIREPMIVLNEDLRVVVASHSFYTTFHTSLADAHDELFYELGNGQWNSPDLRKLLEQVIPQQETIEEYEVEHEFEHLGKRIMVINARELKYENGQKKMLLSILDVTDQRAVEAQKERLMHQKDTLLKEMRHRIANSLQLIASVILLKASSVQSEESKLHLEDAHDRILSIATVQRNLDPTEGDDMVPVVPYLTTLCKSLAKSMIGGRKPITLTVTGTDGNVTPDEAISIGLLTTELVINSLKHAFPSGEGTVTITYKASEVGWKLSIVDDGVGMPPGGIEKNEGLGTSIVESLANQLSATVTRKSTVQGTTVLIEFS